MSCNCPRDKQSGLDDRVICTHTPLGLSEMAQAGATNTSDKVWPSKRAQSRLSAVGAAGWRLSCPGSRPKSVAPLVGGL